MVYTRCSLGLLCLLGCSNGAAPGDGAAGDGGAGDGAAALDAAVPLDGATAGDAATPGADGAPPVGPDSFPASAPWYKDVTGAGLASDSATIIGHLQSAGWGTLGIDVSFAVLHADASVARRS